MNKQLVIDSAGFITLGREHRPIEHTQRTLQPVELMSDTELQALPVGSALIFDVECFPNYWCVAFKHLDSGKYIVFEQSPASTINTNKLQWILCSFCLIGFNSINYDMPLIQLALTGADNVKLKEASNYIIDSEVRITPYIFEQTYKIKIGRYNHIDLFNVCPVNGGNGATPASLKLYAGRLHARRLQDLPYPDDAILTQNEAALVLNYCCNDLSNTELLYKELSNEIQLRIDMSYQFGVDLRSKSDAQIAESVICKELEKVLGYYPKRPADIDKSKPLKYQVPGIIWFQTKPLQDVLEVVRSAEFFLDNGGRPIMPTGLQNLTVAIGKSVYKLGMGGLHSMEKTVCYVADANTIIADNDVESFYPRTILNQRLYPPHLGEAFLTVYEQIVQTRIAAKAAAKSGDKRAQVMADSLKITINGSFGKLGNPWSALYAPQLMLQVTITGQLVLLMLIEALESIGVECISGNTDGVISRYLVGMHDAVRRLIGQWEAYTGYRTEETRYKAVYSNDVNNYVAIKLDGTCKTKGSYSERGSALNSPLSKNPEATVCIDAVLKFLTDGTPLEQTIRACTDFRRFVCVRAVRAPGGEKNGKYLGKVVRWYYPLNEAGFIAYVKNGNKVAMTEGARPVMDMPDVMPTDIDYEWYIKAATSMLFDCGRFEPTRPGMLPGLW